MSVEVLVPAGRLQRWVDNFAGRHGETRLEVADGGLSGDASDGSRFLARAPFDRRVEDPTVAALAEACAAPPLWGVVLVRKGGFAVARLTGERLAEHKIGQRHVQGRTKAGGQSQQRFARRRDNQARDAYRAAADHVARILGEVSTVVLGGDEVALEAVLADRRLAALVPVEHRLAVPDPKRAVLDAAIRDARSVRMSVTNADGD